MKGAFQIAKVFNIPVRIHWSFFLLILWVVYLVQQQGGPLNVLNLIFQIAVVLVLFTCVVLHEFGHALTARRYGVNTMDIIISPIGGVARLDRMPDKPIQEFWVAIAGPLVNFGIIIILWIGILLFREVGFAEFQKVLINFWNPDSNVFVDPLTPTDELLFYLVLINLVLAVFNLLPAFPLDGGRIFRALLSIKFGRFKATRIASYVGQFFAVLLLIYGLYQSQFITAVIGVFVFSMAQSEFQSVKWESVLNHFFVKDLMFPIDLVVDIRALSTINTTLLDKSEHYFIRDTLSGAQVIGVISKGHLLKALNSADPENSIKTLMIPLNAILLPDDLLRVAYYKMQYAKLSVLPVIENGALVGQLGVAQVDSFVKQYKG